jgi:hypothetical protein
MFLLLQFPSFFSFTRGHVCFVLVLFLKSLNLHKVVSATWVNEPGGTFSCFSLHFVPGMSKKGMRSSDIWRSLILALGHCYLCVCWLWWVGYGELLTKWWLHNLEQRLETEPSKGGDTMLFLPPNKPRSLEVSFCLAWGLNSWAPVITVWGNQGGLNILKQHIKI